MAEYQVTLPISGYVLVTVEADSESEAIEKALLEDIKLTDIEEWEAHDKVVEGNVWRGVGSPRASAELV